MGTSEPQRSPIPGRKRFGWVVIAITAFEIAGAGVTLGGGLLVFLNRSAAMDLGLRWTAGSFSKAEYRGRSESIDLSANSARFSVGFAWWAG